MRITGGTNPRRRKRDGYAIAGSGTAGIGSVRLESRESVTKVRGDDVRSSSGLYQRSTPGVRSKSFGQMQQLLVLHQSKKHWNPVQ